jgi:bacillopeptidase F
VEVNGQRAELTGRAFRAVVPVGRDVGELRVTAFDDDGVVSRKLQAMTPDSGNPELTVTTPADGAHVNGTTVTVAGTVAPAVSLTVDGVATSHTNGAFSTQVTLGAAGSRTISVVADDDAGGVTTVTRALTIDRTARYPPLGAVRSSSGLAAAGFCPGRVGARRDLHGLAPASTPA